MLIIITAYTKNSNQEENYRDKHLEIDLSVVGSSVRDRERSDVGSVLASNGSSSLLGGHELGDLDKKRKVRVSQEASRAMWKRRAGVESSSFSLDVAPLSLFGTDQCTFPMAMVFPSSRSVNLSNEEESDGQTTVERRRRRQKASTKTHRPS